MYNHYIPFNRLYREKAKFMTFLIIMHRHKNDWVQKLKDTQHLIKINNVKCFDISKSQTIN